MKKRSRARRKGPTFRRTTNGIIKHLSIACAIFGLSAEAALGPGPVTVTMASPLDGSTVSGIINVSAHASSLAGPIVKVEFYRDGILFATWYRTNQPAAPGLLRASGT